MIGFQPMPGLKVPASPWVLWFFGGLGLTAVAAFIATAALVPEASGVEVFGTSLAALLVSVPALLLVALATRGRSAVTRLVCVCAVALAAAGGGCAWARYCRSPRLRLQQEFLQPLPASVKVLRIERAFDGDLWVHLSASPGDARKLLSYRPYRAWRPLHGAAADGAPLWWEPWFMDRPRLFVEKVMKPDDPDVLLKMYVLWMDGSQTQLYWAVVWP